MTEILTPGTLESILWDAERCFGRATSGSTADCHALHIRILAHDFALRAALAAKDEEIARLRYALSTIADSPSNDADMLDVWAIAADALGSKP